MRLMITSATLVILASCGAAADCKQPANAGTAKCVALNAVLDCTTGELPNVVTQLKPIVEQLIEKFTGADGNVDWASINLKSLGTDVGSCVMADIFMGRKTAPPKLAPGEVVPSFDSLTVGLNQFRVQLAPGVKIKTPHGDM